MKTMPTNRFHAEENHFRYSDNAVTAKLDQLSRHLPRNQSCYY